MNSSLRSHVTLAYGKSPREWKNSTFAWTSFQLILWPVSEREEPNKQRGINGQGEGSETQRQRWAFYTAFNKREYDVTEPLGLTESLQVWVHVLAFVRWCISDFLKVCLHVSLFVYKCVVLGYWGR